MYTKKFTLHEHCHRNFARGFKSSQENPRNKENANSIVAFFWRLARLFHSRWSLGCILLSLWNICFNGGSDQNFNYTTNQTFCHVYLHMLSVDTIEIYPHFCCFKCSLKRLWHLKTHSQVWDNFWQLKAPLKMMINAFYFISKALFVLKIFKSLSWLFGHVSKRPD